MARSPRVLSTFVNYNSRDAVAKTMCIQILARLAGDRNNIFHLVFCVDGYLDVLVEATTFEDAVCRKYACFAVQNISCNEHCLEVLGSTPKLLENICQCCQVFGESREIRVACMVTLRNLSRRSENVRRMMDTSSCMPMLLSVVRTKELNESRPDLIYWACEVLHVISDMHTEEQRNVTSTCAISSLDEDLPSGTSV